MLCRCWMIYISQTWNNLFKATRSCLFCGSLSLLCTALATVSYRMKVLQPDPLYVCTKCLSCSLFAAHLQFKWFFHHTGLQQTNLSQAYMVCTRHTVHTQTHTCRENENVWFSYISSGYQSLIMCGLILPLLLLGVITKCFMCFRTTAGA